MANQGLPFVQQIMLDVVAPPIVVCLWWLFSRGTALTLQGGRVSERTKKWEKIGFVILLPLLYLTMFGITIYFHFAR
jgi:hypothetical protein